MNFLLEIWRSIRIADVLDIVVVTILLYSALTWFRETTSRSVLIGISVLAIIYFAARAFDMYMTVFLFQAVFAVLLIALVVVFQEDLRRAFERLASLGTVRERFRPPAEFTEIDALVETAAELAVKKVGALMVLKGEEPLDRHIEGGILTNARISKPLLDSIFDPHSMGHDGAVIIDQGQITQFAAHLPLSKNIKEVRGRGTRHSAALGVSECTDALCIVVSEERGEVSLAENGKLKTIATPTDVKNRLVQFYERYYPKGSVGFWRRLVRENAFLKVLSLITACVAWVMIVYDAEIVQQTFAVPIEYHNRGKDLVIDDESPGSAKVTLSGYQRAFSIFDPAELKFVIDLQGAEAEMHRFELDADRLKGQGEMELERVSPGVITVILHRPQTVELKVEPRTTGYVTLPAELVSVTANPPKIRANVLKSNVFVPERIFTEPIDLGLIKKTTTVKAKLIVPEDLQLTSLTAATVDVVLEIRQAKPVEAPKVNPQ